jgi:hypothetical protein
MEHASKVFLSIFSKQASASGVQCVSGVQVYCLLGSSVQKQALRDRERNPHPACQHRRVGVESDVVTSILMLGQRYFHVMEKLLVWLVYLSLSPAPLGGLLGGSHLSLCSLEQTAPDFLAALHPHRSWPKQVRAHRGKRALTKTSHRSQARGETASFHQDRSHPPRPVGQAGSNLAADSRDHSTRDEARGGIESFFACIGSANQRLILTSQRSPQRLSP